jgi:predicted O-methyltransferase YrrM
MPSARVAVANVFNRILTRKKDQLWIYELKRLASNPSAASCLERLFPRSLIPTSFVQECLDEVRSASDLHDQVEQYANMTGINWEARLEDRHLPIIFFTYAAIRWVKPKIVVETGCASGWTTSMILLALHNNEAGHLWTLDLPPRDASHGMKWLLPESMEPGFIVPNRLRDRWTLELGDTKKTLVPLLNKLESVDYFLHDSDHSYCHMIWEYATAWPFLRQGGLLVSDDISLNAAFWDFAIAVKSAPVLHGATINVGALVKT